MNRCGRKFFSNCLLCLVPMALICSDARDVKGGVSGTIFIVTHQQNKLSKATITFERNDGIEVKVDVNGEGQYHAALHQEGEYTASVRSQGLCTLNRPPFHWKPGDVLRFDFMTVICPDIDLIAMPESVDEDEKANVSNDSRDTLMFYKERNIHFGTGDEKYLIIAFGASTSEGDKVRFQAYDSSLGRSPIFPSHLPEGHLPVTVRFENFTISSDRAVLNRKDRLLMTEGNVSVANGTDTPSSAASCVVIDLKQSALPPASCQR
jgi:hypothetical protein